MNSLESRAHTRTSGSMVTLTPIDRFSNEQIFQTPYIDSTYGIAVLVITVNIYPVVGLYINNQTLDVSINNQTLDVSIINQTLDVGINNQTLDVSINNQTLDVSINNQTLDVSINNQTLDVIILFKPWM